jgi:hypothetical protein
MGDRQEAAMRKSKKAKSKAGVKDLRVKKAGAQSGKGGRITNVRANANGIPTQTPGI